MINKNNESTASKSIRDVFLFWAIPGSQLNPIQMFFRAILEVFLVLAVPSMIIYLVISLSLGIFSLKILWLACFSLLCFGSVKLILHLLSSEQKESTDPIFSSIYANLPDKIYYIFLSRVPIISGLFFFSVPLISQFVAANFLQNMYVMESGRELILVMFFSTWTSVIIISLLKTIITTIAEDHIADSFNDSQSFRSRRTVWTICLFLPTWILLLYLNNEETNSENIEWIYRFLGIVIGIIPFLLSEIYQYKKPTVIQQILPKNLKQRRLSFFGVEIVLGIVFYIAFITLNWPPNNSAPTLIYLLLIIWVLTLFTGLITLVFDHSIDKQLDHEKKLLLDFPPEEQSDTNKTTELQKKTRLSSHTFYWPVILFLIVFSVSGYRAGQVDHVFELKDSKVAVSENDYQKDFQTAIGMRLCPQEFQKSKTCKKAQTLVVVAASGGGIQASGWMTQALAGLQEGIGTNFTKAIGLISSASGGSVGSMFYLDQFDNGVLSTQGNEFEKYKEELKTNKNALAPVVKNATEDWLNSVGWGLAFPDLFRLIGLPCVLKPFSENGGKYLYLDRGDALEKAWQKTLGANKVQTLDDRRLQMLEGKLPISVYNTTLVENGRRLLVSPMKFVKGTIADYVDPSSSKIDPLKDKVLDFKTLYSNCGINGNKDCDLAITTAARLSASFPYVTPMARNDRDNYIYKNGEHVMVEDPQCKKAPCQKIKSLQNYHIADGGYFDNAGTLTAMEWLNNFLNYNNGLKDKEYYINIEKVILLQINAFPEDKSTNNQEGKNGLEVITLGPLSTLAGVRDSSQIERNQKVADLLECRWLKDGIKIQDFTISFPGKNSDGKDYNPPLSWRLTKKQKENLVDAWRKDADIQTAVASIKDFWTKPLLKNEKCRL